MSLDTLRAAVSGLAPHTPILAGVACIALLLLAREFRSWYRLSHVPGPLLSSLSVYYLNKVAMTGNMSFILKELGDRYGPLVRVGPNQVLFGDSDTYRRVSGVRSDFMKGPWYEASRVIPDQDSLFSLRDDELRKELKAKLAPGYSGKEGTGFEAGVDRLVGEFVHLIERKYISTPESFRPIEFAHKAQFFALDVISELGFGEAIGFLANDEDMYKYVELNDSLFPVLAVLLNMTWITRLMRMWPLNKSMPKEGDKVGLGGLMTFAAALVDQRLRPNAEPGNDMMQAHIRNGLTRKELMAEVFLEMIAGSDSTATAVRMTLLCLINTPSSLERLRKEIDEGISERRISSPITDAEAYQLPYLQAVIKEGIRMFPPSTGHNYKQVPKGGVELHGIFLPEGTQLGVNIHGLMRDTKIFGPDATVFRPERWLESTKDEERLKEMASTVELAFGHGKFQCLGKTIAAMELNKIFVELLRRFDFAVVNPPYPLKLWDAAFWVTSDFWLRVSARK